MKVLRAGVLLFLGLVVAPRCLGEKVPTPKITPDGGLIQGASMSAKIECSDPKAVIFYTKDDSNPNPDSSPRYAQGSTITVDRPMIIKARAYKFGATESDVAKAEFRKAPAAGQVSGTVPDPDVRPLDTEFSGELTMTVNNPPSGAEIHYTKGSSTPAPPTVSSPRFPGRETIRATTIVKMRAFKAGMNPSNVVERKYVLKVRVADPVVEPREGTYGGEVAVTASCGTADARIHFTTGTGDFSPPDPNSPVLPKPLKVTGTLTIKLRAFKAGMNPSDVVTRKYVIKAKVTEPVVKPDSGEVPTEFEVRAESRTRDAEFRYTMDESEPREGSPLLPRKLKVEGPVTVKVRGFRSGMEPSDVVERKYRPRKVAKPVFVTAARTFSGALAVGVTCSESGAVLHYTTDGSKPTETSPVLYGMFTATKSVKVRVRAFKKGMEPSDVAEAEFTLVATTPTPAKAVAKPVFTTTTRNFSGALAIGVTCAESGAVLHYTTDRSEPTEKSPVLYGMFTATQTMTVKVRAFKQGMKPSDVVEATFTRVAAAPTPAKAVESAQERAKVEDECRYVRKNEEQLKESRKQLEELKGDILVLEQSISKTRKESAERRSKLGLPDVLKEKCPPQVN